MTTKFDILAAMGRAFDRGHRLGDEEVVRLWALYNSAAEEYATADSRPWPYEPPAYLCQPAPDERDPFDPGGPFRPRFAGDDR